MKTTNLVEGLSFDDVLIIPNYSSVTPDKVDITTSLSSDLTLSIPIVSAAMDTVSGLNLALSLGKQGGISVIHKNNTIEEQVDLVKKVKAKNIKVLAAIGVAKNTRQRTERLIEAGVDGIVIDTAHGHSYNVMNICKKIKKAWNIFLVAGNIGTKEAAKSLIDVGVDCLKVGLGPGSICTTRIMSGVGVPQISAIDHVASVARPAGVAVIADGGIKNSGDIAKAMVAGANAVMLGSLLAGTDESPGEFVRIDGRKMKYYRGMGSASAMKSGSADRYAQHVKSKKFVEEGIEAYVSYKGKLSDVLFKLTGGLKASLGYMGCKNLQEVYEHARFMRITQSGMIESKPHSVVHKAFID